MKRFLKKDKLLVLLALLALLVSLVPGLISDGSQVVTLSSVPCKPIKVRIPRNNRTIPKIPNMTAVTIGFPFFLCLAMIIYLSFSCV